MEGFTPAQEEAVPTSIKSVFQCEQCEKTYKQRTSLNNHMKKVHIQNGTAMSSEISKEPCLKKTQEKASAKIDILKDRHVKEMTSSRRPSILPSLSNVIDKIKMRKIEHSGKHKYQSALEELNLSNKKIHEAEDESVTVVREDSMEEETETQSPSTAQSEKATADSPSGVPLKKPLCLPDGAPTKEGSRRKQKASKGRPDEEIIGQRAVNSKGE